MITPTKKNEKKKNLLIATNERQMKHNSLARSAHLQFGGHNNEGHGYHWVRFFSDMEGWTT
jgi:hypothetical protein